MKISDKIKQSLESDPTNSKTFYSFEYFPPKTDAGICSSTNRHRCWEPTWQNRENGTDQPSLGWCHMVTFEVKISRNAGGVTSDYTLDLCSHIQNFSGLDVLMHITCTFMTRDKVLQSLERVRSHYLIRPLLG